MLGRGLLKLLGAYSKPQQLRNGASVLYQGISGAAENTELQEGEAFKGVGGLVQVHLCILT